MKKLVHKNQIIITALAVMIVVAGYLNFTGQEIATGNILQKDAKQTQSTVKADGKKTDKKESKTTKVSKKALLSQKSGKTYIHEYEKKIIII